MSFLLPELRETRTSSKMESSIRNKIIDGTRLSTDEGVLLYSDSSTEELRDLATLIRERKNKQRVYFNRNFHIEPTNKCVYDCKFCSYSRALKDQSESWEFSSDQMLELVKKYDRKPVTEVHIVGGVHPSLGLEFFGEVLSRIKKHRPELHLKAFTAVEIHYMCKRAKVSYEEGIRRLIDNGLQSIPGGGAEIFSEEIRNEICADKCTSDQWLEIHRIIHQSGLKSNATMLYGHIEKYHHRIDHMNRLRDLQDRTGGFQTFIPLKFRNKNNQMSHISESTQEEDLRNYAVSRIYMDNFDHLKAYWPMIGRETAALSLDYGVDDLDGTIDDTTKIYTMAGSEEIHPTLSTEELVELIHSAGRDAIERGTLYEVIHEYPANLC